MIDLHIIVSILSEKKIEMAGELILNPSITNGVYLPIKMSRDILGKQFPSHRNLADARSALASTGISAEFLLIDREAKSIEEGLRTSLIRSFPDLVRNAFVTTRDGIAHTWVDAKRAILAPDYERIDQHIHQYVAASSLRGAKLYLIGNENIATNTEFLSILRRFAPMKREEISLKLEERGFVIPSLDWINRKFDVLRKAGMVVRLPDNSYVLTAVALHKLGTRKDRNSPDISRLLALARGGC